PPPGEELRPGEPEYRPPVLSSARFWMLAVPLSTPGLVITGLVFHQSAIVAEHGLSPQVAAGIFVPYALASACMSLIAGDIADRFGPKVVFTASMACMFAAMSLALVMQSLTFAIVYSALLGACGGFSQIASGVTWAHFYGRNGLG